MTSAALPEREALVWDKGPGTLGMALFIASESLLFVSLLFAYFYLGSTAAVWPPEAPRLPLALVMLAVLAASSLALYLADRAQPTRPHAVRWGLVGAMAAGLGYLVLQGIEFAHRLHALAPGDSAYASLYYLIVSTHGLHVVLGLIMLAYTMGVVIRHPPTQPPGRVLLNVGLYWHFVGVVWVVIVVLLYVFPHL